MNNVGLSLSLFCLFLGAAEATSPFSLKKQKNMKHSNTNLDIDYHENNQRFEAFGSAQ